MIPDAAADFVYFSDLLQKRHGPLAVQLTRLLEHNGIGVGWIEGTKDIWCRDFMPIQIARDRFVQFDYRPDYLMQGYQHTVTPPAIVRAALPEGALCRSVPIRIDGGNVVHCARKAVMTDRPFRGRKKALQQELRELLEVDELIVIPAEPYELFGHADGIVRFVDEETVLVNDYSAVDPRYGSRLLQALERAGLRVIAIPYQPSEEGPDQSAHGVYVNFLQARGIILAPVFGIPEDDAVLRILTASYPGSNVEPVNCEALGKEGGLLNCISWGIETIQA